MLRPLDLSRLAFQSVQLATFGAPEIARPGTSLSNLFICCLRSLVTVMFLLLPQLSAFVFGFDTQR